MYVFTTCNKMNERNPDVNQTKHSTVYVVVIWTGGAGRHG